jgi:RNA polymerase sigma-70 factor (ECF subfamily)
VKSLSETVAAARGGDPEAYSSLVKATQAMAFAVAADVLRDRSAAEDAVQQAYLRAFRRLEELADGAAFAAWFRRIVLTVALNARRAQRRTLLQLDEIPEPPSLDESETHWSEKTASLAAALLTLTRGERRVCDRRYYGRWSVARLAADAGVGESVMRKRLQRIRDKLRREVEKREMEMSEHREIGPSEAYRDLPAKIIELLARPRLIDIPESPVAQTLELLRGAYSDFVEHDLPEILDLADAGKGIVRDAMYIAPQELHRIDANRILRYDLTLPLLLTTHFEGEPLRIWAAGKTYRVCETDAKHLEAFHQADVLWVDDHARLDAWQATARVLRSVHDVLPGRTVKIVPTQYPMCSEAWELEVDDDGKWSEVLAWGVFTDRIVRHLGADPRRHTAIGVGYGLERIAMLRYGIDDIRKVDVARVA